MVSLSGDILVTTINVVAVVDIKPGYTGMGDWSTGD